MDVKMTPLHPSLDSGRGTERFVCGQRVKYHQVDRSKGETCRYHVLIPASCSRCSDMFSGNEEQCAAKIAMTRSK